MQTLHAAQAAEDIRNDILMMLCRCGCSAVHLTGLQKPSA